MSKYIRIILYTLLIGYGAFWLYTKFQGGNEGKQAPDFETTLIDGRSFKLSELSGHYILLDFWGSWCGPCYKDLPKVSSLFNKYGTSKFSDGKGFKVVTVALEKNDRSWRSVASRFDFNWPDQIVEISSFVLLSSIAQKYGVTDIPAKFLIYPDGNLKRIANLEEIDQILRSKLN